MRAGYNLYCTVANQNYLAKFQTVRIEIKSAIEKQQYGKCKL